jgi:hypothetical protein
MKPFLLIAFVRWIFGKMFSKVIKLNEIFRETLQEAPWLAVLAWIPGTMMFVGAVSFLGMGFIDTDEQMGLFVLAQIAIAVLYLVVNGVTIMYEAFKQDRKELFNVLKDTK